VSLGFEKFKIKLGDFSIAHHLGSFEYNELDTKTTVFSEVVPRAALSIIEFRKVVSESFSRYTSVESILSLVFQQ